MTSRRCVGIALSVLLLFTGCGSTVARDVAGRSGTGDIGESVGGHAEESASASRRARAASTFARRSQPSAQEEFAGAASVGGKAPPGTVVTGSKTPVRLGFVVIKGGNTYVARVFGAGTPVNFGDGALEARAAVADINSRGGINGRKITPVIGEWDVSTGATGYEAVCRQLTEDGHVFAIATVVNITEQFVACGAKHSTPVLNASFGPGDDEMYARYRRWFFSPTLTTLNEENELVLAELKASGRMTTKTPVGVVYSTADVQYTRVLKRTVEPRLKSWGVPYETYGVATQSDIGGAVLRFNTNGVRVVTFISPNGINQTLFMQQAEQQRYHPDYGLGDSADTWFIARAAPREQARKIIGAGALPISNVEVSQYPTTPREKHCLDVIRRAGEDVADRHSSLTATLYCELADEFAAITSRVSGTLTTDKWRAAYTATARTYMPISTFAVDLAHEPHANAVQYRSIRYDDRCSCLKYTSPVRPIT
jgi:hypothetical protein